jgi:hypothetical protein
VMVFSRCALAAPQPNNCLLLRNTRAILPQLEYENFIRGLGI